MKFPLFSQVILKVEVSESQIEPYSNQDFVIDKKSTIARSRSC
ncbi:MAG: hypothetical protein QNJ55_11705 [Xenococcus sp. MO_188.B8]|nr:hypothetical protein [Xenococcus sp. MO_188.B8]